MPEGHTIHRAARRLASVLVGKPLERVQVRGRHLVEARASERLLGTTVTQVEPRGKHLLVHTDAGWSVHSHLRMDGVWHLYRRGERWRKSRARAWLVLGSGEWDAVNFDGPILELYPTAQLLQEPVLTELGPDILVEPFDDVEYLRGMRLNGGRQIGDAVLRQRIVAGIGNIYKNESLYLASIDPWRRVEELTDEQLIAVREIATRIMRDGVLDARAITYSGPGRAGQWVYGRGRMPCRRCARAVNQRPQGEDQRMTFWCATCQQ
ncbi:MAG: DNA-formamidopyrimidine glycosylase family protein [Gaiellales bacterium]